MQCERTTESLSARPSRYVSQGMRRKEGTLLTQSTQVLTYTAGRSKRSLVSDAGHFSLASELRHSKCLPLRVLWPPG